MDNQDITSLLKPPFVLKQCRNGLFICNTNDFYIGRALALYGEFSENEAAIFRQIIKPGQIVLDVGANIGAHTVLFAQLAGPMGRVYAFEPQRLIFQQLCANIALNTLSNVYCYQMGLSSHPCNMVVPPIDYNKLGNFGLVSLTEDGVGESVPINTIDSFQLAACHFIKIDVEGMEKEVLSGATQTIKKFRPIIYAENDRPELSPALINYLAQELDYSMYWHVALWFNPNNFYNNHENIYPSQGTINMLCVPNEVKVDAAGLRKVTGPDDDWRIA